MKCWLKFTIFGNFFARTNNVEGIPGDFDGNKKLNKKDLSLLKKAMGKNASEHAVFNLAYLAFIFTPGFVN